MKIPINIQRTLFLDVETVSKYPSYAAMPSEWKSLWDKKAETIHKWKSTESFTPEVSEALYEERAGIFAEFGKIVCISAGFLRKGENGSWTPRLKSFFDHDESRLLKSFAELLDQHYPDAERCFVCGHNIKEFDIPYICRRMTVAGIALPKILEVTGKKPWELKHFVDTMQLWKFGDFKNYTSLDVLAHLFEIPSPKVTMDGSMVGPAYWNEDDLESIAKYCEMDVKTTMQLVMKLKGLEYDSQIFSNDLDDV